MIPVTSTEIMRKSDAREIESGTSAVTLMARAAKGIFEAVNWKPPVAIVCGVGNNAGDGFAVAELMAGAGIECTLFLLSEKTSETGKYFLDRAIAAGVRTVYGIENLKPEGFGSVLDCIFGTGFKGEVREPYKTAIETINKSGLFTVSADINSGLGGDSGLFDTCVRSELTVSIGTYKSGLFLNSAKDVIKSKVNCDIGIPLIEETAYLVEASDIAHLFAHRPQNSNKGDYGYVNLIGGSIEYSGAAKLANLALSALRSGAGVATLAVPNNLTDAVLPYLLESTLYPLTEKNGRYVFDEGNIKPLITGRAATAIGMGMGRSDEVEKLITYLLTEYNGRLIIDADGLNALSRLDRSLLKNASCTVVLTPHPKEFERLSRIPVSDVIKDPIGTAKSYAYDTGALLLLKGTSTVITDGETLYIVDRGSSGMATAGSGDVLSGVLCGIMGHAPKDQLLLSVAAGAYLTGLAGELASCQIPAAAMLSGDTVKYLPHAMKAVIEHA